MASIRITNLQPIGSDLFKDSESFMKELIGREMVNTKGGGFMISDLGVAIALKEVYS